MTELPIEYKKALSNFVMILANPQWVRSWARGGWKSLYLTLTQESLDALRTAPTVESLEELVRYRPCSPLGVMGATQEYLYQLVRLLRPKTVVETGVFRGISSAFILEALYQNGCGRLVSIDMPNASYRDERGIWDTTVLARGQETGFVVPSQLRERWTLVFGDARQKLPAVLSELQEVDIFYHDSEHSYESMTREYAQAAAHMNRGGVLVSDDVTRNSAFDELAESRRVSWSCKVRDKMGIAKLEPT